jgi:hypothetical protein
MRHDAKLTVIVCAMLAVVVPSRGAEPTRALPAFPGAEGFGTETPGGRGGRVIEVTNLDDRGPGSFRAAVQADGPRIVVFRVAGNIALRSSINIRTPYLTIAGQSAPGDGVCLINYPLVLANTHDVVVRFLRVRPGDQNNKDVDSLGGRNVKNVIVDHCSASWSIDECVTFYGNQNVTVQWCLIGESLRASHHEKGAHGFGGIWGGKNGSYHHNLLAHHSSRNPRFAGNDPPIDFRNNVIYNWGYNSAYGGENSAVNIVANYYKPGPATKSGCRNRILDGSGSGGRWYITGNFVDGDATVTADNWRGVHKAYAALRVLRATEPFASAPVRTQTAADAYSQVLAQVGATLPRRDLWDARVVEEVRTGTAHFGKTYEGGGRGIIDSPADVGGWPVLTSSPAAPDRDHDGIADAWESTHGLDPTDPNDGPRDRDGDGYTNVEEYLNALVPAAAFGQ